MDTVGDKEISLSPSIICWIQKSMQSGPRKGLNGMNKSSTNSLTLIDCSLQE